MESSQHRQAPKIVHTSRRAAEWDYFCFLPCVECVLCNQCSFGVTLCHEYIGIFVIAEQRFNLLPPRTHGEQRPSREQSKFSPAFIDLSSLQYLFKRHMQQLGAARTCSTIYDHIRPHEDRTSTELWDTHQASFFIDARMVESFRWRRNTF